MTAKDELAFVQYPSPFNDKMKKLGIKEYNYDWDFHSIDSFNINGSIISPPFKVDSTSCNLKLSIGEHWCAYNCRSDWARYMSISILVDQTDELQLQAQRIRVDLAILSSNNIHYVLSKNVKHFRGSVEIVSNLTPKFPKNLGYFTLRCSVFVEPGDTVPIMQDAKTQEYLPNMSSELESFLNSEKCSDIKLCLEDKEIFAHRLILTMHSPVFAAMFENDMKEKYSTSVYIEDIKFEIFFQVLRFMYCGQIENLKDIAIDIVGIADRYQIQSLKDLCSSVLSDDLTTENALKMYEIANLYNLKHLKKEAFKVVIEKIQQMKSSDLKEISDNEMTDIINVFKN